MKFNGKHLAVRRARTTKFGMNFFPTAIFVLHNLSPWLKARVEFHSNERVRNFTEPQRLQLIHSPTILSSMNIDSGGCVDSWHSYTPSSSFRAFFIRSAQFPKCLVCSTRNRSSLLYVLSPTVNNKKSFRRNQLTWNEKSLSFQS